MNKTNYLFQKLIAGAVALAMVALVAQASAENVAQKVTVLKVKGAARYSTDGKSWMTLKQGDTIPVGGVIQTAEGATVDIEMGADTGVGTTPIGTGGSPTVGGGSGGDSGPKANIVHIFESSVLAVDKLTLEKTGADEVSETQLDLRAGRIMGNVKKLSSSSRYEVKVPNGVAGIRGTTYVIDASGNIVVIAGQVIISYVSNGQVITKTISAGQSFNPVADPNGNPGAADPGLLKTLTIILDHLPGGLPQVGNSRPTFNGTVIHISVDQ